MSISRIADSIDYEAILVMDEYEDRQNRVEQLYISRQLLTSDSNLVPMMAPLKVCSRLILSIRHRASRCAEVSIEEQ